ncbi:MAG TPA: ABC transporter permease [Herpetosiphonaceae bacterium]
MRTVLLIALRELRVMLRRPSFFFATLLMPLVLGAIFWSTALLERQDTPSAAPTAISPAGWVDLAGVIHTVPPELQPLLIPYEREADAVAAMRAGTINSYMLIAPDYRQSGRVLHTSRQLSIMGPDAPQVAAFEALLRVNLTDNPLLVLRLQQPPDLRVTLVDQPQHHDQRAASAAMASMLAWVLAFAILNGAGWLVQAVAEEKENRTIEIVLTSVQPWQIMAGKVAGLGALSLLQLGFWLGLGFGLSRSQRFDLGAVVPGAWIWMILFFVLGFLLFGAMMAALGAVGATARESGQISGFMLLPVLVPLWFSTPITENPGGTLALTLSLIPITAPVTIMLRLGLGGISLWQLLLSVGLLALAVAGMLWLAARLFRSTTLLTGTKLTPRALWRVLRES